VRTTLCRGGKCRGGSRVSGLEPSDEKEEITMILEGYFETNIPFQIKKGEKKAKRNL